MGLASFLSAYSDDLLPLIYQHLVVALWALPIATVLGIGGGIMLCGRQRPAGLALAAAGVVTTIPSVALFGLMIPVLARVGMGVGRPPAIVAVALYAVLPILRNTLVGLEGVSAPVLEAATALGLSPRAVMWRVRLPLAAPVILAGIRTAVVMGIGITAIAAYVGAGGLGRWVFAGIRQSYPVMAAAGALLISALALLADLLLAAVQRSLDAAVGGQPLDQASKGAEAVALQGGQVA